MREEIEQSRTPALVRLRHRTSRVPNSRSAFDARVADGYRPKPRASQSLCGGMRVGRGAGWQHWRRQSKAQPPLRPSAQPGQTEDSASSYTATALPNKPQRPIARLSVDILVPIAERWPRYWIGPEKPSPQVSSAPLPSTIDC